MTTGDKGKLFILFVPLFALSLLSKIVCSLWASALASPVTFLTGGHVVQIAFGQISPSASSTRDLGTRLLGAGGGAVRGLESAEFYFHRESQLLAREP